MKKKKIKNLLLIQIFLLSTIILAINTDSSNFAPSQNNKWAPSTTIEREIPQLSQTIAWENNGTVICNANCYQYSPEICCDGDGGAIITWHGDRLGSDTDIYTQRIASDGTTMWMDNGTVICNATSDQYAPKICCDGDGGAIITWQDPRGIDEDIYAQRVASNGTTMWMDNGTIICNAIDTQDEYQICCDGDGGAIITWYDNRMGNPDIYAQRIASNGTTMWMDNGTVICNATDAQQYPQICCDGDGDAIITWEDYRDGNFDIYAQRVASNGTMMWMDNGTVICNATNIQNNPQICCDGDGDSIIIWQDDRDGNYDIYAQRVASDGTTMWMDNGTVICNATNKQINPQICCDGDGGAIITWQDDRDGNFDIYAQRIALDEAKKWMVNGTLICNAKDDQTYPQICCDRYGGVIITWIDERGIDEDIYAQRITSNGAKKWKVNGIVISNAKDDQKDPRICCDRDGGVFITWWDKRGTFSDIYAQRIIITIPRGYWFIGGDDDDDDDEVIDILVPVIITISIISAVGVAIVAVILLRKKRLRRE